MDNLLYAAPLQDFRLSGKPGVQKSEHGWSAYGKDYARLLHAHSFRRLQNKMQLFPGDESDFFRNRLTHSLEVAQIACGIASRLNDTQIEEYFKKSAIDLRLVEFAAIAHDLGHPPFGHNGEKALDELMYDSGGFESNAQTLRILTHLEKKLIETENGVSSDYGLDLTMRSLASVLKYDKVIARKRKEGGDLKKGYYYSSSNIVRNIKYAVAPGFKKKNGFKTIECSIMDIADDIAYSTYDLEDSLHAGFVTPMMLISELAGNTDVQNKVLKKTNETMSDFGYDATDVVELLDVLIKIFEIEGGSVVAKSLIGMVNCNERRAVTPRELMYINFQAIDHNDQYVKDCVSRTRFTAERVGRLISAVDFVPDHEFPQLSYVKMKRAELLHVEVMKHLNYELVIRSPKLSIIENRGKDVIKRIFDALMEREGSLLPIRWKRKFLDSADKKRVVCDYIAGMTDRFAVHFDACIYGGASSIFSHF